jgi:hypothetical protein
MADTGNVDVVRAAVAALNDGDTAGYLSYFEPSCKRWVAGIVDPLELDVMKENLISLAAAFDPLKLIEEALFGDGDLVCARWRLVGTHVADYLGVAATAVSRGRERRSVTRFAAAGRDRLDLPRSARAVPPDWAA